MVYSKNDTSLYLCPKDHSTRKEINCLLTVDAMTAMKKKMLYFLLLLAALLPACGTSQMADSIWQDPAVVSQSNERLSIFYIGENKDSEMMRAALASYTELYPDVEVGLIKSDAGASYEAMMELYNQTAAQIMTGEGPDVFIINDEVMDVEKLVRQGIFADMDPFFQADHFDWEPYNQTIMNGGVWNGKRFVIPLSYTFPLLITSQAALDDTGFDVNACKDFKGFLEETMRFLEDPAQTRRLFYGTSSVLSEESECFGIPIIDYDARGVDLSSPLLQPMLQWRKTLLEKDPKRIYDITGGLGGAAAIRDGQALWTNTILGPLYGFYYDFGALKTLGDAVMMPIRDVNGGIQAKLQYCVAVRGNSENLQNAYNYIKLLLSPHIQHAINRQVLSVLNSANDYFYQKAARGDTHFAMAGTDQFTSTVESYYATDCPTLDEYQQLVSFAQEITGTYYGSHSDLYNLMRPFLLEGVDYEETLKVTQHTLEIYITE